MPRVGTSTEKASIETIEGCIKGELLIDFGLATAKNVPKLFDKYIHYYNYEWPLWII